MKPFVYFSCILFSFVLLSGCLNIEDKKTTIDIKDNYRHYYPILAGQELQVMFDITNTGEHPLILTDIISSCGCVSVKKSSINSIPAGKTGRLILTYDSSKNIGYVEHYVILYGNFATSESREVIFDVNVVPDALYTKDYEELYNKKQEKKGRLKKLVEGDEQHKGYYTSEEMSM